MKSFRSLIFFIFVVVFSSCSCNSKPVPPDAAATSQISRNSRRNLLQNGLGSTPPMGWNSRNFFNCGINETVVRQTADALVKTGLAKLGYKYVNIDDCWGESTRDSKGNLVANKKTFPSGIKAIADYVHKMDLKLGLYADTGSKSCTGTMPGSLGHEAQDAKTFASWGIDYLKYDNCNSDIRPTISYPIMSRALINTKQPIFFSMCEWGDMDPAFWAGDVANSWRTTGDIKDSWSRMLAIADLNEVYANYSKPGGWNDPDMLEVGNGGMSFNEYVVHFSLWAISKAPLILGCDVRNLSSQTKQIISNEEVIAVNQDKLGVQATKVRVQGEGELDVWTGPLSNNRTVVLLVNRKSINVTMTAHCEDVGFPCNGVAQIKNLWQHSIDKTTFKGSYSTLVPSHSCKMFVLTPIPKKK